MPTETPTNTKGTLIDGLFSVEGPDSSGEILDIKGADMYSFDTGDGVANWEHRNPDSPGASALDVVGKIVYTKKIFKESDCENDRQKEFYKKFNLPCIYGIIRLADAAGHPSALAIAALMRDAVANNEPCIARYSVEGSTLKREGNRLTKTVLRGVAITVKPCNKASVSGLLSDPQAPEGFETNPEKVPEKTWLDHLIENTDKSESADPMYQQLGHKVEMHITTFSGLEKMLEAGNYNVPPSALVGGAALQTENGRRKKLTKEELTSMVKSIFRDWNKTDDIVKILKHKLPEASDDFINRFADLANGWKFKKSDWKSGDGISIPKLGTPERNEYDNNYAKELNRVFGNNIKKVKIPLNKITESSGNEPVNTDRIKLYSKMVNGGDQLPPIVVRGNPNGTFDLIDGSHRRAVAQKHGLTHLDAFQLKKDESGSGHYAILTAEAPKFDVHTPGGNEALEHELNEKGLKYQKVQGSYSGAKENSYLIHNPDINHIIDMGKRFGQESVLHAQGNQAHLIYTNGPNEGMAHHSTSYNQHATPPTDNYSTVLGDKPSHFSWDFDWNKLHPFHKNEQDIVTLRKFEALIVELNSNLRKAAEHKWEPTDINPIEFKGQKVWPGEASVYSDRYADGYKEYMVLHHTPKEIIAVPKEKFPHHSPKDLVRIPKGQFTIHRPPKPVSKEVKLNAVEHGDWKLNQSKEQHDLLHNTDMLASSLYPPDSADVESKFADKSHWRRMGNGKVAYIKPDIDDQGKNEVRYHNLAKNFFGLGHYVPTSAYFTDPQTGSGHAAVEHVPGEHVETHFNHSLERPTPKGEHGKALIDLGNSGELDKLGLMNVILGNTDRHSHNYLMTKDNPGIRLIDHGYAFSPNKMMQHYEYHPDYLEKYSSLFGEDSKDEMPHHAAANWIKSLDPEMLHQHAIEQGVKPEIAAEIKGRLVGAQQHLTSTPLITRGDLYKKMVEQK